MKIRVRRVPESDLHLVRGLDTILFGDDGSEGIDDDHVWWLLEVDGQMAGFAGAKIHDNMMFLSKSGILPHFRGKGLQKKLIKTREAYARRLKLVRIYSYTSLCNPASANSLIRRGFTMYRPAWMFAGSEYLYFGKDLKYR